MNLHMFMFLLIAISILCLGNFYVTKRLTFSFPWMQKNQKTVWLLALLFLLLQLAGPLSYRFGSMSQFLPFRWVTFISLGLIACLFFYFLIGDITLLLLKIFLPITRTHWYAAACGVLAFSVISIAIGIYQAFSGPHIYQVQIPIENLPEELQGFRIAQISDLHSSPFLALKYTEKIVERTNALNADVIALTGDIVDGSVENQLPQLKPLSELKSKYGVFSVPGNHEYYSGVLPWIKAFKDLGITTLINQHHIISVGAVSLAIAGVSDPRAARFIPQHIPDVAKAIKEAPSNSIKIFLSHQPKFYDEAEALGFHLQLSGHSHGGQFLPWRLMVGLFLKYYKGLYKHKKMWIYVTRGVGFWGPPIRFTVPTEITLIELTRRL